ncbi:MAG: polysaccharide deacetylase family protein [Solobacterium sp.]|jgi:peptidoglycan/xylan/chitin deacetylase (PgdA/CDA1 family)|nr:polysaccharide deacetylase family protein [Solobacterium sp.]MCH4222593.1 polysaccharide deacetylase family protein [Solobacterium sp.]MCH4265074.1 polysaccharide deacetylase family protein [Solobacterium sp.]
MRTSKKRRINKSHLTIFLGAILGICLITAAVFNHLLKQDPSQISTSGSEQTAVTTAPDSADWSSFWNTKAEVSADTALYTKDASGAFQKQGTFKAGALVDIVEDDQKTYLHVADSDFYLNGADVKTSGRWFENHTNLVPYASTLTASSGYQLEDEKGTVLLNCDSANDYQVYVKPDDSDPRYGVKFQNAVYYIPKDQVTDVKDTGESVSQPLADDLPVLMYHFFYSEQDGGTRKDANDVEVNELDQQLNWLSTDGYHSLSMRETEYFMEQRAQIPEKSVAITIDDGDPSMHQYGYPIFKKYGIHATLFVVCGWQPAEMSYDLWEMREDGIELQSHSFLMHQGGCSGMGHGGALLCCSHEDGVKDTKESFDYVDGGFVYCYPFGDINDSAESIVKDAGAKLAFTTKPGKIDPSMDPLALPRVRVRGGEGLEAYQASIAE